MEGNKLQLVECAKVAGQKMQINHPARSVGHTKLGGLCRVREGMLER